MPLQAFAANVFKPTDPKYVVLTLSDADNARTAANAARDPAAAQQLAATLIERARAERDPRLFGRAEALLTPWTARRDAASELLILHADILQNRHDFPRALALLNRALDSDPLSIRARLMRATVLMVRGDFSTARSDCAAIFSAGESTLGSICLGQAMASMGNLEHGADLIHVALEHGTLPPAIDSWAHASLADIASRRGDRADAEREWRAALASDPDNETYRIALADLLIANRAAPEALRLLDLPRPTIGLLVRKQLAETLSGAPTTETARQLDELMQLESRRDERVHKREEALLALGARAPANAALTLAAANFSMQREPIDVRLFARAAAAARDPGALASLRAWCAQTGFKDLYVERALGASGAT